MERNNLANVLTEMLKDAKAAHAEATWKGESTDSGWPEWYGKYMAERLEASGRVR